MQLPLLYIQLLIIQLTIEEEIQSSRIASPFIRASLNVSFTGFWLNDRWNVLFKQFGITVPQYNVLRILRGQKGKSINLMDIQQRMVHRSSNTTRLVEKLRQKELVERIQCPNNRRKVEITITKQGLDLLKTIDPLLKENEKETFRHITQKEAETLNDILNKLRG